MLQPKCIEVNYVTTLMPQLCSAFVLTVLMKSGFKILS